MSGKRETPERISLLPTEPPPRPRRSTRHLAAIRVEPSVEGSWTLIDEPLESLQAEEEVAPTSGTKEVARVPLVRRVASSVRPRNFVPPIPREEPE